MSLDLLGLGLCIGKRPLLFKLALIAGFAVYAVLLLHPAVGEIVERLTLLLLIGLVVILLLRYVSVKCMK